MIKGTAHWWASRTALGVYVLSNSGQSTWNKNWGLRGRNRFSLKAKALDTTLSVTDVTRRQKTVRTQRLEQQGQAILALASMAFVERNAHPGAAGFPGHTERPPRGRPLGDQPPGLTFKSYRGCNLTTVGVQLEWTIGRKIPKHLETNRSLVTHESKEETKRGIIKYFEKTEKAATWNRHVWDAAAAALKTPSARCPARQRRAHIQPPPSKARKTEANGTQREQKKGDNDDQRRNRWGSKQRRTMTINETRSWFLRK